MSPTSSRPSARLRTEPGPITTGFRCCAKAVDQPAPKLLPRRMGPGLRRYDAEQVSAVPSSSTSSRHLLDAGDQFVDGLVHRHLLADHAVHRLGPDVLVVQDGELPVLGEVERRGAAGELVPDRLAMPVRLPEGARLARLGHREPAAERTLDIGPHIVLLHQERDELLAFRLVLGIGEDQPGLDVGAVLDGRAVRCLRERRRDDVVLIGLLAGGALRVGQRRVGGILEPLRRDRDREIVRHHDRLVVEGDVVVRVLPGGGGGRRAALDVGVGVILQRVDQPVADLGIVDQQLAVIVDQLDVVGVHEGVERLERVGGFHAHRLADAVDALAGRLADRRLHLVAPERPVVLPLGRDVGGLEAGLLQHVAPDLDVHALLLQREAVIGLLLGDVVVEQRCFQRVRCEGVLHRQHDVGEILELALEGPLALRLHVVGVGIGDVGHGAGIQRGDRLRDHVLDRVLRQFDLDAGLGFEFLDRVEQRVVFGFVKSLAPPDRDRLALGERGCRCGEQADRGDRK